MSEEIIKVLDDLGERFGVAIDWSSEAIVPYLEDLTSRFVKYEILTSLVWIVLAVVVSVISFVLWKKIIKSEDEDFVEFAIGIAIFAGIASAILVLVALMQIFDIIQAVTIPEIMIINYIKTYI